MSIDIESWTVAELLSSKPPSRPVLLSNTAHLIIADKLADLARRKNNTIVYNFGEAAD